MAADLISLTSVNNVLPAGGQLQTEGVGPSSDTSQQYNLVGYSFGAVVAAQQALADANNGLTVDNLILIGAPINKDLVSALQGNANIKNLMFVNIPGDPIRPGMTDFQIVSQLNTLRKQQVRGTGHFFFAPATPAAARNRRNFARGIYAKGVR